MFFCFFFLSLGLFALERVRSAANLRERHTSAWYLNGRFHLSGEGTGAKPARVKNRKENTHSTGGNKHNVSAGGNLRALIVLKRQKKKRRPPGSVSNPVGPERSDESRNVIYCRFYLPPISLLRTCENCCSFCLTGAEIFSPSNTQIPVCLLDNVELA